MTTALIIGAGAVGRGFVAPLLARASWTIDFVEKDARIAENLRARGRYRTAFARPSGYDYTDVPIRRVLAPNDIGAQHGYDLVFVCVGTRNYLEYAAPLAAARCVFVLENERECGERLRAASGNARVYFGIADVIVSNAAPPEARTANPLCVVSETGDLILEDGPYDAAMDVFAVRADPVRMAEQWACKFYIHNACHAVGGFLGALYGHRYVHEAMADDRVGPVVENAMRTVARAVVTMNMVHPDRARVYLERELTRFTNTLLGDPITRVARDPLRKLDRNDRLIQALALVLEAGLDPLPFALGVRAALEYRGADEEDMRFEAVCRTRGPEYVLRRICGLKDAKLIADILAIDPRALRPGIPPARRVGSA